MSAKVKTRCPVCAAKYYVRAEAVGHRARCASCQAVFRVKLRKSAPKHTPTTEHTTEHDTAEQQTPKKDRAGRCVKTIRLDVGQEEETNPKQRLVNEADILRWLNEGDSDRELAARPRVISDDTRTPATAQEDTATRKNTAKDTAEQMPPADSGAVAVPKTDHNLRQFDGDNNDSQVSLASENLVFPDKQDAAEPSSPSHRWAVG